MRPDDLSYYTLDDGVNYYAYAIVDLALDNQLNAILSITRTVFVSIVLSAAAMFFSRDVEDLVLSPIENMLKKV